MDGGKILMKYVSFDKAHMPIWKLNLTYIMELNDHF